MKSIITLMALHLLIIPAFSVTPDQSEVHSILVIGDSNSAIDSNWVTQLQEIRTSDIIYNTGISGNTIGFDNLGRKELNALRNVDGFMDAASEKMNDLDAVIIMLGTNDCKKVYTDSTEKVIENMETLIKKVKNHPVYKQFQPQIFIISPPPQGPDSMLLEKYQGGSMRAANLVKIFSKLAEAEDCIYIDTYTRLSGDFLKLTLDGIHLNPVGMQIVAETVDDALNEYFDQ